MDPNIDRFHLLLYQNLPIICEIDSADLPFTYNTLLN